MVTLSSNSPANRGPQRSVATNPGFDSHALNETARQHLLINPAFLQEIKDSNPHLWHETHHLRALCELDPIDTESPQQCIKSFVRCLDELRDLLSLQFTLEESYGFMPVGLAATPKDGWDEEQQQIQSVIEQHRRLYLHLVDLVEQAEELQYRGCDQQCLQAFAKTVERFSMDLTAHERAEAELIRARTPSK